MLPSFDISGEGTFVAGADVAKIAERAKRATADQIAEQALPGEWKRYAIETFTKAAEMLLAKGFTAEEAADLLSDLRAAVSDSYGD